MKSMTLALYKNRSHLFKNKSHSYFCQQFHPHTNIRQSHGVHCYFQGRLKESVTSKEYRTIIDSPEMSAVIGEFVERMID